MACLSTLEASRKFRVARGNKFRRIKAGSSVSRLWNNNLTVSPKEMRRLKARK